MSQDNKMYKVDYIQNGDYLVPFRTYYCNECIEPVLECWPRYEDATDVLCIDCALKIGKISGKEYAECCPGIDADEAAYHDGLLYFRKNNEKWPWEKTNRELRRTTEYRKWRNDVIKRDRNTCKRCGDKHKLEAHHIRPFVTNPDVAFSLENGITLCKECHKYVHQTKDKEYLWQEEC